MRGAVVAVLVLLAVAITIPLAHALAVSYEYLDGNQLELPPGATYYYKLILQNEDDDPVNVSIKVETPIAAIIGPSTAELPGRTFGTTLYLNITVPQDAAPGTELPVRYVVSQVGSASQGGQVPFAVSYDRTVTVVITPGAPAPSQPEPVPVIETAPTAQARKLGQTTTPVSPWVAFAAGAAAIIIIALLWRVARRMTRKSPPKGR